MKDGTEEKYPSELRSRLMDKETSIRSKIACPGTGKIVTLGFPGLAFDVAGNTYIDRERMEATLLHPALDDCRILIVLLEKQEIPEIAWSLLSDLADQKNMLLVHLPIADYEAPDQTFMKAWAEIGQVLEKIRSDGDTIALSCHYGAGRSGTIAARILMECGLTPDEAVAAVRAEFAESIESQKQLDWLHSRDAVA